jgi:F-type H+-transporting ATPase subunit b
MLATSNFLIPGATFLLELIAFILVLVFIAKKVLPPLRKAMADRAEHIRSSIEAAEVAKADAESLAAQRREILENARHEARSIIEQANETSDQLKEEGRKRGQEEYERLLESARKEIDLERERARAEVMSDLGALVLDAAEKVIGGALDAERHRALVDEAISAAVATSGSNGGAGGAR